jgi:hypothetical protein
MMKTDKKDTQKKVKKYHKPQLAQYGKLANITQAGIGSITEVMVFNAKFKRQLP